MRVRFAAQMYGSAWAVLDQSKIAFAALAAPNSIDLKKFVKVLEQRKPKGVASRNRRQFFPRPLDLTAWLRTPTCHRSSGGIWKMSLWSS
jgi:hypothetical protein